MYRPLRIEYPDAWYHVMNRERRSEAREIRKFGVREIRGQASVIRYLRDIKCNLSIPAQFKKLTGGSILINQGGRDP